MGNKEIGKSNCIDDNKIISPNKKTSSITNKMNSKSNKIYSEEKINKHIESK